MGGREEAGRSRVEEQASGGGRACRGTFSCQAGPGLCAVTLLNLAPAPPFTKPAMNSVPSFQFPQCHIFSREATLGSGWWGQCLPVL